MQWSIGGLRNRLKRSPRHEVGTAAGPTRVPGREYLPDGWDHAQTWALRYETVPAADSVDDSYRQKWMSFLEAVDGPGPLGVYHHSWRPGAPIERANPSAQNIILAYAYALARAISGTNLSVFDWGGGRGEHYVLARRLFPDVEFDYHCQEVPLFCSEGRELLPEVTFYESDQPVAGRYDLVMASGSLQLEEDWRSRLRTLAERARGWVFLTEVPLTRREAFVVRQRGEDWETQEWVFRRSELIDVATASGLILVREFVFGEPFAIDNAPDAVTYGGLLFASAG
jgi:putative methyltransferase (TIGR04325 family)